MKTYRVVGCLLCVEFPGLMDDARPLLQLSMTAPRYANTEMQRTGSENTGRKSLTTHDGETKKTGCTSYIERTRPEINENE